MRPPVGSRARRGTWCEPPPPLPHASGVALPRGGLARVRRPRAEPQPFPAAPRRCVLRPPSGPGPYLSRSGSGERAQVLWANAGPGPRKRWRPRSARSSPSRIIFSRASRRKPVSRRTRGAGWERKRSSAPPRRRGGRRLRTKTVHCRHSEWAKAYPENMAAFIRVGPTPNGRARRAPRRAASRCPGPVRRLQHRAGCQARSRSRGHGSARVGRAPEASAPRAKLELTAMPSVSPAIGETPILLPHIARALSGARA